MIFWVLTTALLATASSDLCDLSGDWTEGWAADFTGGPPTEGAPHITVRKAITPFGTPHAQYVVDFNAALALHPDMQTCLGNGTCSSGQFGKARAVNSSMPACTFIQWPDPKSGAPTDGGWCRSPYCGLPPTPPPPTPMPWPHTYNLARSTMVFPDGNHTGPENAARAAIEARYGMVTFGWETEVCNTARPSNPKSACTYAGAEAALDAAAVRLKAINPDVKVVLYRNTKLGLSIYKDQCDKMYDPAFSGFYLKNESNFNATINNNVTFPGDGVVCPGTGGKQAMDQYLTDFRNASAAAWFVDTVVGRVARSPHADGVWFDDPSGIGAENPSEAKAFTPAELKVIRAATAATLQQAAESLVAAGKPLLFNVPTAGGMQTLWSVIDDSKGRNTDVCISALRAGTVRGATNAPSLYYIPYFSPPPTGPTVAHDFLQHLAAFLLVRGQYSWFGHNWISAQPPVWYPEWDWDVGEPVGAMVESAEGFFSREWTKGTVTLNCSSWEVGLPFASGR